MGAVAQLTTTAHTTAWTERICRTSWTRHNYITAHQGCCNATDAASRWDSIHGGGVIVIVLVVAVWGGGMVGHTCTHTHSFMDTDGAVWHPNRGQERGGRAALLHVPFLLRPRPSTCGWQGHQVKYKYTNKQHMVQPSHHHHHHTYNHPTITTTTNNNNQQQNQKPQPTPRYMIHNNEDSDLEKLNQLALLAWDDWDEPVKLEDMLSSATPQLENWQKSADFDFVTGTQPWQHYHIHNTTIYTPPPPPYTHPPPMCVCMYVCVCVCAHACVSYRPIRYA